MSCIKMFHRDEITLALERLGQLALAEDEFLHAVVLGGAAMVLAYNARPATHDVDAVVVPPPDVSVVRQWAKSVAQEFGWPEDWLNDAAKGCSRTRIESTVCVRGFVGERSW